MNAPDVYGHGVHIGIDEASITSTPLGMYTNTYGNWGWTNMALDQSQSSPVQFEVTNPGRHTINIWASEDGVAIDQLLITDSWSFVPTGNETSKSPYVDLTLRSAWLNLSLPEDNGWRTFSAEVIDVAGRENSSTLMVEFDDLAPPIIISGWDFLSNNSQMPIIVQTDVGAELWLNSTLIEINETGFAEIQLDLHPTYWVAVAGDPNNATTWEWVDLNSFRITARDLAGNWNSREFEVAYDGWGAHNNGPEPQIVLTSYGGISDGEFWLVEGLMPPDRLNVKQTPLRVNIDAYFDTKQVCAYFIDEGGIEHTSACISQYSPPWGLNDSSHLREGAPPPPSNIYIPFSLQVNHSGLTDGRWQIFVETLDWSGNWGWGNFTLLLDREAPIIEWVSPINNSTIWDHKVPINWNISEISEQSLAVDGVVVREFSTGDLTMQTEVTLDETGLHQFCLLASDLTIGPSANVVTDCIEVYLTPEAYEPTLGAPWDGGVVNSSKQFVDLHIGPEQGWSLQIWDGSSWVIQNGSELSSGDLVIDVQLNEGNNSLRFEVEALERMYLFELSVLLDSRAPHLTISSPLDGFATPLWQWNVTGECEVGLTIVLELESGSKYSTECDLEGNYFAIVEFLDDEGLETITVQSWDIVDNLATVSHTILIDRNAPRASLQWLDPGCGIKPVSTVFNPDPIASCHLELRADFLDPDISFWSISVEKDRRLITSQMGGYSESNFVIVGLGSEGSPGTWTAELIVEDAAGNRQTYSVDDIFVSQESALSTKASTPGSMANIVLLIGLLVTFMLISKRRRSNSDPWFDQMPTPLDPELLLDEAGNDFEELGFDELSIPSSHGPIGAPPSSHEDIAIADATILQKVKDSKNK
jgi:hypothetical protein